MPFNFVNRCQKMVRPKSEAPRDSFANVRLTAEEREEIEATARSLNVKSISEYMRYLHKLNVQSIKQNRSFYEVSPQAMYSADRLRLFHKTKLGQMYLGDSLDLLHSQSSEKSFDLIMTSPPFGLVRKKTYGNEDAEEYCNWFRPFAEGFKRVLKDNGSLVIDTPGMREFGLTFEEGSNSDDLFPAIQQFAVNCRYSNCRHLQEVGCAVVEAVLSGELENQVYESYLKLIKEQRRFEMNAEDKKRFNKQSGRISREAKGHRDKYKY